MATVPTFAPDGSAVAHTADLLFALQTPRWRLRRVAGQTWVTANTWAASGWDTSDQDTDGVHSGSSGNIVAVTAGLYDVGFGLAVPQTVGLSVRLNFFVNGTQLNGTPGGGNIFTSGGNQGFEHRRLVFLNAADILTCQAQFSAASVTDLSATANYNAWCDGRWVATS